MYTAREIEKLINDRKLLLQQEEAEDNRHIIKAKLNHQIKPYGYRLDISKDFLYLMNEAMPKERYSKEQCDSNPNDVIDSIITYIIK